MAVHSVENHLHYQDCHKKMTVKSKISLPKHSYGTRPLSRCYLRSYLVKNTAGAHKESSKKYKSSLEATSNDELNTSITRA